MYELIAALTGRTVADIDTRLTIFAVGDDDQNIYAFNGASPEFIRRFERDYNAKTSLLVENYRSSGHIINAANAVITTAQARMKTGHAIRRNDQRINDPPGGAWQSLDPVAMGRVQILAPVGDPISQAQAAVAELTRLSSLDTNWNWARCAVIAREWSYLEPFRSICEQHGIPAQLANEGDLSIWHLRETQSLRDEVHRHGTALIGNGDLKAWIDRQQPSRWIDLLSQALDEHALEIGCAEVSAVSFIEWLAEWCRDARRCQRGLLLMTAHRAKGLEFDHVVVADGGWGRHSGQEDADAPKRLYYVAMTRAKQTLTLTRLQERHPFHEPLKGHTAVHWRPQIKLPLQVTQMARRYRTLTLKDVDLGFAGRKSPSSIVHRSIKLLSPGDRLQTRRHRDRWELLDRTGRPVGALARSYDIPSNLQCTEARVAAVATWNKDRSDPKYLQRVRCDHWEVVVPELIFEATP